MSLYLNSRNNKIGSQYTRYDPGTDNQGGLQLIQKVLGFNKRGVALYILRHVISIALLNMKVE
ncbi:MAG: hypothetical protein ACTHOB_06335 [Ginsengibacter sp.]|jgi:hypothetical protein